MNELPGDTDGIVTMRERVELTLGAMMGRDDSIELPMVASRIQEV